MEFRGYSQSEVSPCILATESKAPKTVLETKPYHQQSNEFLLSDIMTIRKLTPLECWRLMGFKDNDYYKAESVVSNTQLYKQAGNSIVVSVLEGIFEQLFKI
ncbi:DNA cytosine methyltransferase [Streptococcus salivarius]|uniref:DNA cytosine methyltransferase n=2 Tax=Streptococcus TaxID=1301 RepID=UPI003D9A4AA1